MMLVVDTNILFSFFWENSFTKKILMNSNIQFVSPKLAPKELKKYSSLIMQKTGISKKEFQLKFDELFSFVKIVSEKEYKSFLKNAEKISPDKDDSEFFAICLKLKIPLWSNDKLLKNQNEIEVLSTKDILELIF